MSVLELFAGIVVGIFLGATGVGAGSLLAPLLILLGHSPAAAVSAGLVTLVIAKGCGSVVHLRLRSWPPRDGWIVVLAGLAAVVIVHLSIDRAMSKALMAGVMSRVLGVLLIAISVAPFFVRPAAARSDEAIRPHRGVLSLIGVAVGGIVSLTSAGSGTLLVMFLLRATRWSVQQLAAISNVFGFSVALLTLLLTRRTEFDDLTFFPAVIIGATVGTAAGAFLSRRIGRHAFDIALRVATAILGTLILLK